MDFPLDDVVFALLSASGGHVEGKTIAQKLAYFLGVRTGIDLGFAPHFYGPFSRALDQEMQLLTLNGLVDETTAILGTNRSGWPIRQFSLEWTDEGKAVAKSRNDEVPELFKEASEVVDIVTERLRVLTPRGVSLPAKVHYVLSSEGRPLSIEDVSTLSNELGWEVSENDVDNSVGLLEDLGLLAANV